MISIPLSIREESRLTADESGALGGRPSLAHCQHYARSATDSIRLFFAKAYQGDLFLGLAPVIRLTGQKSTDMLRPEVRRWLGPLIGITSRRTTYLVDSSFLAFEYTSPFLCPLDGDQQRVRAAIVEHLEQKSDAQIVWISEPRSEHCWAQERGYQSFATIPMVDVQLGDFATVDEYLASLSKKRRKNWRADRRCFEQNGGSLEYLSAPIEESTLRTMHACLKQSARQSELCIPYESLMNDYAAFSSQDQQVIVARCDGAVAGFFSFFANGPVMQQCHGGFDQLGSQRVNAYPNLINAAIEFALAHGFLRVALGPLNNETKRRAASRVLPMTSSVWCRDWFTRWFLRNVFLENFQVYKGSPLADVEILTSTP